MTDAGTVTLVLLLARVTCIPVLPAAMLRPTLQEAVPAAFSVAGLQATELTWGTFTFTVAVAVLDPLALVAVSV